MRLPLFAVFAFAALSTPVLAGPAEDLARARIATVAKADVSAIVASYAPNATLQWVGGPLDGSYSAPDKIKEVWTKYSTA